jgi:hypothetical protein
MGWNGVETYCQNAAIIGEPEINAISTSRVEKQNHTCECIADGCPEKFGPMALFFQPTGCIRILEQRWVRLPMF